MKRIPSLIYRAVALTGLWLALPLYLIIPHTIPSISSKQIMIINIALIAWVTLNNLWGLACEGKRLDEMCIGDGLIPETGLQKESHLSQSTKKIFKQGAGGRNFGNL